MQKTKALFALALALLSATIPAFADRPLVSEVPTVVSREVVKIDVGTTYTRYDDSRRLSIGELQVKTGVTDKSEVFIRANQFDTNKLNRSTTPFVVGAKYALLKNVALVGTVSLPNGGNVDKYQPGVVLAVAQPLFSKTNLIGNIGYKRAEVLGVTSSGLSGSVAVTQNSSFATTFAEVFGDTGTHALSGAVGLSKPLNSTSNLDFRVGRSLSGRGEPNYFVGAGFTLYR